MLWNKGLTSSAVLRKLALRSVLRRCAGSACLTQFPQIVKERQMEFAADSDQEFLHELFGNDASSLFEYVQPTSLNVISVSLIISHRGPVWVYVLERRRAVEVWNALMGDPDPDYARETSPNSLRALFGIDRKHNGLMGSPDAQTAEEQIACLFQSSPPFPAQELSYDGTELDNVEHELGLGMDGPTPLEESIEWRDRVGGFVSATNGGGTSVSGSRQGPSSVTSGGSGSRKGANGKVPFKARPVPRTTLVPDIAPRTTRAAALRAGVPIESAKASKPRVAPTKEELKQTFMDVPGHKRSSTIQVASTAPPTVAPRMTRAASLRINGGKAPQPSRPKPRPTSSGGIANVKPANGSTFEGVPGHKRRETISVASVAPPSVAPRLNKSAELRAKKEKAPPSSFMCMSGFCLFLARYLTSKRKLYS